MYRYAGFIYNYDGTDIVEDKNYSTDTDEENTEDNTMIKYLVKARLPQGPIDGYYTDDIRFARRLARILSQFTTNSLIVTTDKDAVIHAYEEGHDVTREYLKNPWFNI